MEIVTVFRRIPPPVIGMIGVRPAPAADALEAVLDWLETTGSPVERIDPSIERDLSPWPVAASLWQAHGEAALPLVIVAGQVASTGVPLSRSGLARAVGRVRALVHAGTASAA